MVSTVTTNQTLQMTGLMADNSSYIAMCVRVYAGSYSKRKINPGQHQIKQLTVKLCFNERKIAIQIKSRHISRNDKES